MILDKLGNAVRYNPLHEKFASAFDFLNRLVMENPGDGLYEIEGRDVYATLSLSPGRRREDARLEAHRKYIDIQFVLNGIDTMGWLPRSNCRLPIDSYDSDSDIEFFRDEPDLWIPVRAGMFVIFFPEDTHMPLISESTIHKVVVKIQLDRSDGDDAS